MALKFKDLPVKVFLLSTSALAGIVLSVLVILGLLARNSVLDQAVSDVVVLTDIIEQGIETSQRVPVLTETLLGENMKTSAEIIAAMISIAEASGLDREQLIPVLQTLVGKTDLDEIWVTDERGHAYLSSVSGVDFTFVDDPTQQPQASQFYPLLTGERDAFIQDIQKREIDDRWFKYVGVTGLDKPRIVQVGLSADDIRALRDRVGVAQLLRALVLQPAIRAIYVVDRELEPIQFADETLMTGAGLSERQARLVRKVLDSGEVIPDIAEDAIYVGAPVSVGEGMFSGAFFVALSRDGLDALLARIVRISALIFLVAMLISGLISFQVAQRIAAPIWQLTKAATAVQRGRYRLATELHPEPGQTAELSRLVGVFHDMAVQVEEREQTLDALVQERTTELQQKNIQLTKTWELIDEQLQLARELQQASLPAVFPPPSPGLIGVARMQPALQVGGDFYDCFSLPGERVGVVIADVSGKGVAAAFFAALTRNEIRQAALEHDAPAAVLRAANQSLCEQNPIFLFVTVNYAVFDLRTQTLVVASAGHPAPVLRSASAEVTSLPVTPGCALGILPDSEFQDCEVALSAGDSIVFYTDGISEAENEQSEEFSEARMYLLLGDPALESADALIDELFRSVRQFAGGAQQSDDITAAVVSVVPQRG